jgi:hypothetical protein
MMAVLAASRLWALPPALLLLLLLLLLDGSLKRTRSPVGG